MKRELRRVGKDEEGRARFRWGRDKEEGEVEGNLTGGKGEEGRARFRRGRDSEEGEEEES